MNPAENTPPTSQSLFRILSLDGGGAKGVYTLGVLREVEALAGKPLGKCFDLIYGTSTGAIIASLLALNFTVERITELYFELIPSIMKPKRASGRTARLRAEAERLFERKTFSDFCTGAGIVASNWDKERPLIFKTSPKQAHGRGGTFVPGFGNKVADAVVASCAAFPFFKKVEVKTQHNGVVTAWDGGFVANNPTLFAIADAVEAYKVERGSLRVLSVGCGSYPPVQRLIYSLLGWAKPRHFLKLLNTSSCTIEQIRAILFSDVQCVRISEAFSDARYCADLLESDQNKLRLLYQLGSESFGKQERDIRATLQYDTLRKAA